MQLTLVSREERGGGAGLLAKLAPEGDGLGLRAPPGPGCLCVCCCCVSPASGQQGG